MFIVLRKVSRRLQIIRELTIALRQLNSVIKLIEGSAINNVSQCVNCFVSIFFLLSSMSGRGSDVDVFLMTFSISFRFCR